jgi:hypothetical protein
MRVELLWWEGCPSWPEALRGLKQVLGEEGLDPESVELVQVMSDEQAERDGFHGSPTIRIDGEDIVPPQDGHPVGLSCRIYRLRDGRPSPTPDLDDVRDAVRRRVYAGR